MSLRPLGGTRGTGNVAGTLRRSAVVLPAVPQSAAAARRHVASRLEEAGQGERVDTATLLVSEVVTNAILHAGGDVTVRVDVLPSGAVTVAVDDTSDRRPVHRQHSGDASTGRGLELVDMLADDCGVDALAQGGKSVWFTLGGRGRPGGVHLWEGPADNGEVAGNGRIPVRLLGVPVALFTAWTEYAASLLRDYALRRLGGASDMPYALEDVTAAQGALALLAQPVEEVARTGQGRADVTVGVTWEDAAAVGVLQGLLDDARALSIAGQLLTRPALPEIVALRDWCCEQVEAQMRGLLPQSWAGTDVALTAVGAPETEYDTAWVTTTARAVLVATDDNRIVAVSTPAADALGWPVAELVGRRIIVIVPPRLREAHVAGFTRHLTTGSQRLLGIPTVLPALHRDGHEIEVTVVLERVDQPGGRAAFLAWLDPAPD